VKRPDGSRFVLDVESGAGAFAAVAAAGGAAGGTFELDLASGALATTDLAGNALRVAAGGEARVELADSTDGAGGGAGGAGAEDGGAGGAGVARAEDVRLEPRAVLCLRRDGSGVALLRREAGEAELARARAAGEVVLQEPFGTQNPPEHGGARFSLVSAGAGGAPRAFRELVRGEPITEAEMAWLRGAAARAAEGALQADGAPGGGGGGWPALAEALASERAREAGAGGDAARWASVEARLAALAAAAPATEPPEPAVQRPPARIPPSAFRGVLFPDNPPVLRPPPPPPRTKWTRRVLHPVLIGHTASFTPY
jgi:hypothetical protein